MNFSARALTSAVIMALCVRSPSVAQQLTLDRPGTSTLTGKIKAAADASAAGYRVLARHLSTEHVFSSQITDRDGEYRIEGVPYGYYELAIQMPGGVVVADRVVNVPPSGKLGIVLTVQPSTMARSAQNGASPPRFPGTDQPVLGTAVVAERLRGRDFWTSPMGVGILAGIGGLALLALVAADDDDTPATTF